MKIKIACFITDEGDEPFTKWFDKQNVAASAHIVRVLHRMEEGNFSNVKSVGSGVFENKIHFGPGYRIYFGQDGDEMVILLGGGTKKRQNQDIHKAQELWTKYKSLKKRR